MTRNHSEEKVGMGMIGNNSTRKKWEEKEEETETRIISTLTQKKDYKHFNTGKMSQKNNKYNKTKDNNKI